MSKLRFYPTIDDRIIEESNLSLEKYYFYFKEEGSDNLNDIEVQNSGFDTVVLYDEKGYWDVRYYNLIIQSRLVIDNIQIFFGRNGIAPRGSKIGVGFKWFSRDTKLRGFQEIGEFNQLDMTVDIDISHSFKKSFLRNEVSVEIIFFIKEEDFDPSSDELHLANIRGTVIGEFGRMKLVLEGMRSEFPIVEVKDPNKPLWELRVNWATETDQFVDSVKLIINPAHPKFKEIDLTKKRQNPSLMDEIMISTITMLLVKAQADNILNFGVNTNDYEEGSVGAILSYWINVYSIEEGPIEQIQSQVNKALRFEGN